MSDDSVKSPIRRSEEIEDIIERMPNVFGFWVTVIILGIFGVLLFCGFYIKYPDVVTGQATVYVNTPPIKLIANTSGKIYLNNLKSQQSVYKNQILAVISTNGNYKEILDLGSKINPYNPSSDAIFNLLKILKSDLDLGELTPSYFAFLNSLHQLQNLKNDETYKNQTSYYGKLLTERKNSLVYNKTKAGLSRENLQFVRKFYDRDSILIKNKVISESEFDNLRMSYIASKDAYQNTLNNVSSANQMVQETENNLLQLPIQKEQKYRDLRLELASAYFNLKDGIKAWQYKYVIKAPFPGKIQFLKFWEDNQSVNAEEQIFTIIPETRSISAQVMLPTAGSGKVKEGQNVIVKLDNFPFDEYGSLKGKVTAIALTSNELATRNGSVETYMVSLTFPNKMVTNYGEVLKVNYQAKGSAEIITNDRMLIDRIFENLKYRANL